MKSKAQIMQPLMALSFCLCGCAHHNGTPGLAQKAYPSQATNSARTTLPAAATQEGADASAAQPGSQGKSAAQAQEANPSEWPLPNFGSGPGLPLPIGINFYSVDDRYPSYLLCEYVVSENHYDRSNEPEWFNAALLQIRGQGRESFPPLRWVAVTIRNRAEHKGAGSFERSFKAGALFPAEDVFEIDHSLQAAVAHVRVDRHPFKYDPAAGTPGSQQRWLIVERHASAGRDQRLQK